MKILFIMTLLMLSLDASANQQCYTTCYNAGGNTFCDTVCQ